MPFWKSKSKLQIPPVEPAPSSLAGSSYSRGASASAAANTGSYSYPKSSSSTYVKSRDGDPLATYAAQNPPVPQPPTRARYTRESLLGPRSVDHGSGFGAGAGAQTFKEPIDGKEDDEDVEGIKTRIWAVKQESVNSTRNALMLARQAEETARATSQRLADQSGVLYSSLYLP